MGPLNKRKTTLQGRENQKLITAVLFQTPADQITYSLPFLPREGQGRAGKAADGNIACPSRAGSAHRLSAAPEVCTHGGELAIFKSWIILRSL